MTTREDFAIRILSAMMISPGSPLSEEGVLDLVGFSVQVADKLLAKLYPPNDEEVVSKLLDEK